MTRTSANYFHRKMIHGNRAVYTWRIRELFPEKIAGQTLKKESDVFMYLYRQNFWRAVYEKKNRNLPTEKFLFLYIEYLI